MFTKAFEAFGCLFTRGLLLGSAFSATQALLLSPVSAPALKVVFARETSRESLAPLLSMVVTLSVETLLCMR